MYLRSPGHDWPGGLLSVAVRLRGRDPQGHVQQVVVGQGRQMVARERRSKTLFACWPCFNQPIERLNNIFVLGARQFRRETLSEPSWCRRGSSPNHSAQITRSPVANRASATASDTGAPGSRQISKSSSGLRRRASSFSTRLKMLRTVIGTSPSRIVLTIPRPSRTCTGERQHGRGHLRRPRDPLPSWEHSRGQRKAAEVSATVRALQSVSRDFGSLTRHPFEAFDASGQFRCLNGADVAIDQLRNFRGFGWRDLAPSNGCQNG